MAERPQPGPHRPLAKPQPRRGLRRPPARRPARARERVREGRGTRRGGLRAGCGARGRSGVAGRVGDGVGRAHPAPRRAPARADSSRTDFCGPNCPKPGSARGEPPCTPRRGETRPATRPGVGPIAPTPNYTPGNTVQSPNRANILSLSSGSGYGKLGLSVTSPFPPAPAISHGSVHNWASSIRCEFRGGQLGPGPNHSRY